MEVKPEQKDGSASGSPPPPSASPESSPTQDEQVAPVMLTTMQPVPLNAVDLHQYADDRQFVYQVDGKHVEFVRQVCTYNPSNVIHSYSTLEKKKKGRPLVTQLSQLLLLWPITVHAPVEMVVVMLLLNFGQNIFIALKSRNGDDIWPTT